VAQNEVDEDNELAEMLHVLSFIRPRGSAMTEKVDIVSEFGMLETEMGRLTLIRECGINDVNVPSFRKFHPNGAR
jgi:hypothetical protein